MGELYLFLLSRRFTTFSGKSLNRKYVSRDGAVAVCRANGELTAIVPEYYDARMHANADVLR